MKHIGKILVLAVALMTAACSADRDQQARELVNNFYQTLQSTRPDGALSLGELITFRHFLSIQLFDLLKDVSVAEESHQARTDEETAPLVEGDLFTTHPQGASTYRLLACEMRDNGGVCAVELIYSDASLTAPIRSTDRVILSRDARGWVIDNIEYGGGAGLHQGDLRRSLRTVLGRTELNAIQ